MVLYLFLRPIGQSSRPRTHFFLASLELLLRLLFKSGLYSRAAYNSENASSLNPIIWNHLSQSFLVATHFSVIADTK